MKNYDDLATFIVENVGGKDNILSATHCITRLRFRLKDETKIDEIALVNKSGIIDVLHANDQFQVVIGNCVSDVYEAIENLYDLNQVERNIKKTGKNKGLFSRFTTLIMEIFSPVLGLLCGCGIIKGITVFFGSVGILDTTGSTYIVLQGIGDTLFYFFPIFIGYTSAKRFGLNIFVGIAIGASLIYPSLAQLQAAEPLFTIFQGTWIESPVTSTFMGIPLILMKYSNSVFPIIMANYFASKVELVAKKITPNVIKMFFVPAITLVVTVVFTLLLFGPIVTWVSQIIGQMILVIRDINPLITRTLVGGLWQILVMLGLQGGLFPIMMNMLFTFGYDNVFVGASCICFVTSAVSLAVYLKTKNKKLKEVALPAAISAIFGVSEPAIYGVTVPLKRPFLITLFSAGVGSFLMALFDVAQYTQAGMGIFIFPAYIDPKTGIDMRFYGALISIGLAMICGFTLTWFFGLKYEKNPEENQESDKNIEKIIKQEVFTSPVNGDIIPLENIDDEVFATGLIGKGVAIRPYEGCIYAPAEGKVTKLFPAFHAIEITSKSNAVLLIHIGINTIQLQGKGLTAFVKEGDDVKQGQRLIEFDQNQLKNEGFDDTVIFIVKNTDNFLDVLTTKGNKAEREKEILAVTV